ncbi:protein of unknown function [Chryseobacterium sp. JV274]|nr:protein of unknown function [Chryseobacterium sp. JV274]
MVKLRFWLSCVLQVYNANNATGTYYLTSDFLHLTSNTIWKF